MNPSTLFGLKQLIVTGTHACFPKYLLH